MHPHTIRVSRRARRVSVSVSALRGVVVTVPQGFAASRVEPFLAAHHAWIERALTRVAVERPAAEDDGVPTTIHLRALEEAWTVQLDPAPGRTVAVKARPGNVLVLRGKTTDAAACARALQRWLQRRALAALPPMLHALGEEMGLRPRAVALRSQRTIWGSCARDGTISLNRQLLFFPPELAACVLVHELAHLRWRGHGVRFWSLVERFVPGLAARRVELRTARRFVPGWAQARGSAADPLA